MSEKYYPSVDETLYTATLENGLRIFVCRRPGFARSTAYFVTDFGSIHREFTLEGEPCKMSAGIAHYLEHKLFDMPGGRDISAEFASLGAAVNAFTSFDMTAYYFSCTEHFETCLRLLLEFVSTPYFTAESVAKEQGIIAQEIGMNEDAPETRVFENLMKILFRRHEIRTPILGDRESIRAITAQTLQECHRAFYTPENMMLCVIADADPEDVCAVAREVLGREKRPAAVKTPCPVEEMSVEKAYISEEMEVAAPMFQLAFKAEPTGKGESAIRTEIVGDLAAEALMGESSALYLDLYERGLIDASFGGGFETVEGCAMLTASGDSDDPIAVRDAILKAAVQLLREGIPEDQFLRMKRSALGRRIRDLDSWSGTCFRLCAYAMSDFDYFRFPELYQQIGSEEVLAFLKRVVRPERCALSVIEPMKEDHDESQ